MEVRRLSDYAWLPTRATPFSAGVDLRSAHAYIVPPHGRILVQTDLCIKMPDNCYGRIAARSGIALNNFIDVGGGVLDADYRGPVGIIVVNHGSSSFQIYPGDRVAQLICERIEYPEVIEVPSLPDTERGAAGFGSSGML